MSQKTMGLLQECLPVFSMLQDENRQKIIILLFDHYEMTVTELTENLGLSRPAVSHHLKLLRDSQLVSVEKVGTERFYRLEMTQAVMLLEQLLHSLKDDMKEYCPQAKLKDNTKEVDE